MTLKGSSGCALRLAFVFPINKAVSRLLAEVRPRNSALLLDRYELLYTRRSMVRPSSKQLLRTPTDCRHPSLTSRNSSREERAALSQNKERARPRILVAS